MTTGTAERPPSAREMNAAGARQRVLDDWYEKGRADGMAQARRRRFWRRFWDVVTIIVVGVMLFASGYLLGHAHIHEVVVYRAPVTVE